jgi:hypothetical protein
MTWWKRRLKRISRRTRSLGFEIVRAYPDSGLRFTPTDENQGTWLGRGRRIISFSLYGSSELYLVGALANAREYSLLFPGWELVFFVGDSVPRDVVESLQRQESCQVIQMGEMPEDSSAMLWRYLPASWSSTEAVLFRDADCRPSARERAAVDEWLATRKSAHGMRDHANHHEALMGGLWGVRGNVLRNVKAMIDGYGIDSHFSGDQRFLRSVVYPLVADDLLIHQDWPVYPDASGVEIRPFPTLRSGSEFVGQGFTDDGAVRPGHDFIGPV